MADIPTQVSGINSSISSINSALPSGVSKLTPLTPPTIPPTPVPSGTPNSSTTPTPAQQSANSNSNPNGNLPPVPKDANGNPLPGAFINGKFVQTGSNAPYGSNASGVPYGSQNSNNPNPDSSVYQNPNTGGYTNGVNANGLTPAQQKYEDTVNGFSDKVNGILNGTIPLSAGEQAQIEGLKQQFQALIDKQNLVNTNNTGTAQLRGYQTGTAEYDPTFQAKTIGDIVSSGQNEIAKLQVQEASAVAQLTQSLQNNDIANIKSAYDLYTSAHADVAKSIQTTIDNAQQAIKDANIANVISSGITDPKDILAELQKDGHTDITASDITTAIKNLSPDAANIYDIQKTAAANGATQDVLEAIGKATNVTQALMAAGSFLQKSSIPDIQAQAAKNGAPQSVIEAIGNAKNLTEALAAAGKYAATLTGDMAIYYQYVQDAQAKGQVPSSYTDWENANARTKAYNTALGSAEGKLAGNTATGVNADTGRAIGTTGSSTIDTTIPGYYTQVVVGTNADGMTQAAIDQDALATALGQPLPVPLGLSGTGVSGAVRKAINNRLAELNSGGNIAANKATLQAQSKALSTQTAYLNNTERAFNTANDTLNALIKWMDDNGINSSQFPDYNKFANYLKSKGIDPGAAGGYNAQIATLRQEYSQVLSRGGQRSVETDNEAKQLIPDGLSPAQLQTVADRIKVDSENVINDAKQQVSTIQDNINGIISPTASSSLIQAETNAQNAVTDAAKTNPAIVSQVSQMLDANNPSTGQPYTYQDIAQILGISF